MNLTSEEAASLLLRDPDGEVSSRSTMDQRIQRAHASVPSARHNCCERRFLFSLPRMERVTFIVDGIPVPCRGDRALYSTKSGMKCLIFLVAIAVDGRPIAWSQSEEGSRTDAYAANGLQLFPWHHPREVGLADTMYQANAHCLTAWKKEKGKSLPKKRSLFEKYLRKFRSRVEHFFFRTPRHVSLLQGQFSRARIHPCAVQFYSAHDLRRQEPPPQSRI